jgi:hypothetical protein
LVDPQISASEATAVFKKTTPLVLLSPDSGVGFKQVPKFNNLLGLAFILTDGDVGLVVATGTSILSTPFSNPIRMNEKQQRAYFKQTGAEKPISSVLCSVEPFPHGPFPRE